ncbi:fibronectin type III domain-containing protein [Flagellimonas sp. DF-77]|uniref:fibronectin type III domain-containing protein n=1 Tax=Flagellimonas algarum TaxID=3230298 RepID=UPI00339341AF
MKTYISKKLFGLFLALFSIPLIAISQSDTFGPIHDAYLQNGTLYNNNLLRIEAGNRLREGFLMFDIAAINGTVTSIDLQLTVVTDAGDGPLSVYLSNTTSWSETTLSNANKPGQDIALGSISGPFGIGNVKNITIAPNLVTGDRFSIIIVHNGANADDLAFGSSTTTSVASRPILTVGYTENNSGGSDNQAPSAPTGLASTGQTNSTVGLTWSSATDNVGVTGYKVYQNGANVATIGNTTSYQVTGLSSATAYTFSVTALDAAGNESASSTTINVTTDSGSSGGGGSSGSTVWAESGSNAIYYSSGNVGIGTSNPIRKLEVFDNNATLARFSGGHSGIQGIQVERQSGDHIRLVTSYTGFGGGLESSSKLRFAVSGNTINSPSMVLDQSGNLGIGTQNIEGWKLAVGGSIRAEEIKVETGWADYVFEADYELRTLAELAAYIETHGHLPNIPSADEVAANGIKLGDMNRLLLEKIEELTLYMLQQQALLTQQQAQLEALQQTINQIDVKQSKH